MDKIVVDSSVMIKWFFTEPHSKEARQVLAKYEKENLILVVPDIIHSEFGNILLKQCQAQGVKPEDAERVMDLFMLIDLEVISGKILLKEAYKLAIAYQRTVYETMYVVLSIKEGCEYITADQDLVNAVNHKFPNVVWLVNWL